MFKLKDKHYTNRSSSVISDITFVNGVVDEPIKCTDVIHLLVPKTRSKIFAPRSLVIAGPTLWNKLPFELRQTNDFKVFKGLLKTHLFKLAHEL